MHHNSCFSPSSAYFWSKIPSICRCSITFTCFSHRAVVRTSIFALPEMRSTSQRKMETGKVVHLVSGIDMMFAIFYDLYSVLHGQNWNGSMDMRRHTAFNAAQMRQFDVWSENAKYESP
jgi:hypothetical protein